jgi:glycosyltransferase involved in cell wall biosynthesis
MKVLHILHSVERSGLESMLLAARDLLRAADVETHVLSTRATEGCLAHKFRQFGFTVHHLELGASCRFFRALFCLIRRERYDVVHIHTEQAFFWYAVVARVSGVPRVVHHVHAYFPFKGTLRAERILQRWLGRAVLGVTTLAVSRSVAANEQVRFRNPSTVVCNWVDSTVFHPVSYDERVALRRRFALPTDAALIVSVGSCIPLKNHALILESLPLLRTLAPGTIYVHVGTGILEYEERDLARRLGVDDVSHFLGARDDIADVLAACDVMIMMSEREGSPMAALEASSSGLPIIAADAPGLRDVVIDGETGVLLGADAVSLAHAVAALLGDPARRKRMGAGGRRRVMSLNAPAAGVASWLAAYRP